jgi:hypothetical protein
MLQVFVMFRLFLLLFTFTLLQACGSSESIFELSPNQSMLMTGKGPGQDGAINPYSDQTTIATVKNMGNRTFSIRVQRDEKVKATVAIDPKVSKEIVLEVGDELYIDTAFEAKAKVTFAAAEE